MQSAAYCYPKILSTLAADPQVLARDCTALRLLRLLQAWARTRPSERGRGTAWYRRGWLARKLDVAASTLRKAFARLKRCGWLLDALVRDESGTEQFGVEVALEAAAGFAGERYPSATRALPERSYLLQN